MSSYDGGYLHKQSLFQPADWCADIKMLLAGVQVACMESLLLWGPGRSLLGRILIEKVHLGARDRFDSHWQCNLQNSVSCRKQCVMSLRYPYLYCHRIKYFSSLCSRDRNSTRASALLALGKLLVSLHSTGSGRCRVQLVWGHPISHLFLGS